MMLASFPSSKAVTDTPLTFSVIECSDLGDGTFQATVLGSEPNGQLFHMSLKGYWFFGRPEPGILQTAINGDAHYGAEIAMCHADLLRGALSEGVKILPNCLLGSSERDQIIFRSDLAGRSQ